MEEKPRPRNETIECVTDVTLYALRGKDFQTALATNALMDEKNELIRQRCRTSPPL